MSLRNYCHSKIASVNTMMCSFEVQADAGLLQQLMKSDIGLSDFGHGAHRIRSVAVKKIAWDQKRLQKVDGCLGKLRFWTTGVV